MGKIIKKTGFTIVLMMSVILVVGCEDSSNDADVQGADPNAAFTITNPASGSSVSSEVITIKGVGFRNPSHMKVSVYTDGWYPQSGSLHHSDNNSWSYGPVYLSGAGRFNNHRVRATAIHADGSSDTAEIAGIVRQN